MSILGTTVIAIPPTIIGTIPGGTMGVGEDSTVSIPDRTPVIIDRSKKGVKQVFATYSLADGPTLSATVAKSLISDPVRSGAFTSTAATDGTRLALSWDPNDYLKIMIIGGTDGPTAKGRGTYNISILSTR